MLPTEQEKLKTILEAIKALGESTRVVNTRILDALENYDASKLGAIQVMPKKERYQKIDQVDNLIINVFALYTPEARDLRELVAFLKITNEFDRIANSSNSFIRDFPISMTNDVDRELILEYAVPMQKCCVNAITSTLQLLELKDKSLIEEQYKNVAVEESKNDDLYKIIEKSLLKKINEDITLSNEYQNVMSALRRLEKIADRALSAAALMHYAKIGGEIAHQT